MTTLQNVIARFDNMFLGGDRTLFSADFQQINASPCEQTSAGDINEVIRITKKAGGSSKRLDLEYLIEFASGGIWKLMTSSKSVAVAHKLMKEEEISYTFIWLYGDVTKIDNRVITVLSGYDRCENMAMRIM